jgi:uncharacterized repeat protein (TIGR04042 family)
MPETRFLIRWPDGTRESCYSPSLVIEDYLVAGKTYALADFLTLSRTALAIASDRVKAKYGVPCGRARAQLARIEAAALRFASVPDARVAVDAFERDGEVLERPST